MKTKRLLPLPILVMNFVTKPLFKVTYPLYWILEKIVGSKLADRVLQRLEKENGKTNYR
jgi:hypothetical protein